MKLFKTLTFIILYSNSCLLFGQSVFDKNPNLKGTTHIDYFVTVKIVDRYPKEKPTYLFAKKPTLKQKKWDLDTNKVDIDNYYLTNKNIDFVSYSNANCACNLFGDTTGNGVMFVHLKPSIRLLTLRDILTQSSIVYDSSLISKVFINGQPLRIETVLVDSEAQVTPIYKQASHDNLNSLKRVEIWTLTDKQKEKYGM